MCLSASAFRLGGLRLDEEPNAPVHLEGEVAVAILDRQLLRDLALQAVVAEDVLEELHEVHHRVGLVRAALPRLTERSREPAELHHRLLVQAHALPPSKPCVENRTTAADGVASGAGTQGARDQGAALPPRRAVGTLRATC